MTFQPLKLLFLGISLIASITAIAQDDNTALNDPNTSIDSAVYLDWVPESQQTQHADEFCFCGGHFIEPENKSPDAHLDPRYAPLRLSADKSEYEIGDELLTFIGNIRGTQGSLRLYGDQLDYNKRTQDINLKGNVQLREPGTLIKGEGATLNRISRSARFEKAVYLVHDSGANGDADEISRTPDEQISMHDASYTLCLPGKPAWQFKAEDITLDTKNDEGFARHTRFYIKGVPVLYLPYFHFPLNNKRKSGFLFPSYSASNLGSDISVPYYVNLAPNYDATLIPRFVDGHGALLEAEGRYLSEKNKAVLSAAYLSNDTSYDKNDPGSPSAEERWLIGLEEQGYLDTQKRWTHKVSFQRVSDDDYLDDLGTAGLDVRRSSQLKSSANLGYHANTWNANLYIESYQALQDNLTKSYRRLPQFSLDYYDDFATDLFAQFNSELTHFDHPDSSNNTVGQRLFYAPAAGLKKINAQGKFELKAGFKQIKYDLNNNVNNFSNTDTLSPNFKADVSLHFDKSLNNNARQTLEPRIQYYYSRSRDQRNAPIFDTNERSESYQQLFNEERFTGHDRISDANRVTLGVSSKTFNNVNQQLIDAGIAQQFYFRDREVSHLDLTTITGTVLKAQQTKLAQKQSNIAAYINFNPSKKWQVNSEYLFNPDNAQLDSASLHFHYAKNPRKNEIINFGYQYKKDANKTLNNTFLEDDIHQISASTVLQVKRNVNLIALANYDLSNHQSREELIGIEYNSCCWRARLAYHKEEEVDTNPLSKSIDYSHSVRAEIQLKGLSGISRNMTSLLEESIEGFDIREKNFQ